MTIYVFHCRSVVSTSMASADSRRHAASAASSRDSAPMRSRTSAASKRPVADRLPAAPFNLCASMRIASGVPASTAALDRRQTRRAFVEEDADDIGEQRLVAVETLERGGPVEGRGGDVCDLAVRPRRWRRASEDRAASTGSRPCRWRCSACVAQAQAFRTCPPLSRSRARIAAVASNPPISGICTSISTRSNVSLARASNASRPLFTTVTWWPRRDSKPSATR